MPTKQAKPGITPGEWKAIQYENGEREINSGLRKIAVMTWTKSPCAVEPEDEANALAISAVPELIAALKRAEAFISSVVEGENFEGCAGREIILDSKAALAKAGIE